jgi:hypothetical protein
VSVGRAIKGGRTQRIHSLILAGANKARASAIITNRNKRQRYFEELRRRNAEFYGSLDSYWIAKIALSMLYLGEGSKGARHCHVSFGNSDPEVICLFLVLFRRCYQVEERKFRCTVQCRADQNIAELELFWSDLTHIPSRQFYASRIDARTIGKPTKKKEYKGVCRIDYFSPDTYHDLMTTIEVLKKEVEH